MIKNTIKLSVPSSYQSLIKDSCLLLKEDTDEWFDFIEIIQKTIKRPKDKVEWKINEIQLIVDADLEATFQSKVNELQIIGCRDEHFKAQCVFTCENKQDAIDIRYNGINCKTENSSEHFADATKGVHVYTHLDRLLDWCSYKNLASPVSIVMYKTVFGRSSYIDLPNADSNNNNGGEIALVQPSMQFDSYFIDENLKFDCKFEQYYPSMAYMYDMKLNGQLNPKVRHLMPFAILKCDLLQNDYFLYDYLQKQLELHDTRTDNFCSLKDEFYNVSVRQNIVLQERPCEEVERAAVKQVNSNNNAEKQLFKFYVTLGDVRVLRERDLSETYVREAKEGGIFGHVLNKEKNVAHSHNMDTELSLLGTKLNPTSNADKADKKGAWLPKIPLNAIKNVASVETCSTKAKAQNELNSTGPPSHDLLTHMILDKLANKVNDHKKGSTFAQEFMKELGIVNTAVTAIENDKSDKIGNFIRLACKSRAASSSMDYEKQLTDKLSLMNKNTTKPPQSNSSIIIQRIERPQQQQQQQQQPQIQKLSSIDPNLDQDLLFDLNSNINSDTNNLLNIDKDFINSIYDDIKQKGVLSTIDNFFDMDSNNNLVHPPPLPPACEPQVNTAPPPLPIVPTFQYKLTELETTTKPKELNTKVLINNNRSVDESDRNKQDPRYGHLIEKFSLKLKLIIKSLLKLENQKVDPVLSEINQFCEKCVQRLKTDEKLISMEKLIEFTRFVDYNIDFIDKINYADLKVDFGYSDVEDGETLTYDLVSNIYSYTCYLTEFKVYMHEFFDFYFSDLLVAYRLIKTITKVKSIEVPLTSTSDPSDPRSFKDVVSKKNLDSILFFNKSFQTIRAKCYKASQQAPIRRESISEKFNGVQADKNISIPIIPLSFESERNESIDNEVVVKPDALTKATDPLDEIMNDVDFYDDQLLLGLEYDEATLDEVNDLLNVLNEDLERITEEKDAAKATTDKLKFNIKPFKIQSSLISEIQNTVKKDREAKKDARVRSRSSTSVVESNKKSKQPRTVSETDANDVTVNQETIEKEVEKKKIMSVLDKIVECSTQDEEKASDSSGSDSENDYVVIPVNNQKQQPKSSNTTSVATSCNTTFATAETSHCSNESRRSGSRNESRRSTPRTRERRSRSRSRDRQSNNRRARSASRSRSRRRRSRSRSRSHTRKRRSYTRSRSRNRRRSDSRSTRGQSRGCSKSRGVSYSDRSNRPRSYGRNIFQQTPDKHQRSDDNKAQKRRSSRSRRNSNDSKKSRKKSPERNKDKENSRGRRSSSSTKSSSSTTSSSSSNSSSSSSSSGSSSKSEKSLLKKAISNSSESNGSSTVAYEHQTSAAASTSIVYFQPNTMYPPAPSSLPQPNLLFPGNAFFPQNMVYINPNDFYLNDFYRQPTTYQHQQQSRPSYNQFRYNNNRNRILALTSNEQQQQQQESNNQSSTSTPKPTESDEK